MQITHYKPAPGLGGEAFWLVADSSPQRNKKTEHVLSTFGVGALGEVPGFLRDFILFSPFALSVTVPCDSIGSQAQGLCLRGFLTLCLWP